MNHPPLRASSDEPLHVAINATSIAPGGGLTGLLGYLGGWKRLNSNLTITMFASRSAVMEAVARDHPEVMLIPFRQDASSVVRVMSQRVFLGRAIARSEADVVMSTNFLVPGCAIPQLVHHRNLKHFVEAAPFKRLRTLDLREFLRDRAARYAVRHAPVNVFVSQYLKERAERLVSNAKGEMYVIHNGLSGSVIEQAPSVSDALREPGRIFSITSPAAHKDNPTLLRTLERLVRVHADTDWQLRIAGAGPWESELAVARSLGVGSRVSFLGFLEPDELDEEFRRASCALFTSRLESFGNGPVEAMARRCPVVAAHTSAMPEVIGDAGLLVPKGDTDAFAQAVSKITRDFSVRERLVNVGLLRIQKLKWIHSAKSMTTLLHVAARSAPASSP